MSRKIFFFQKRLTIMWRALRHGHLRAMTSVKSPVIQNVCGPPPYNEVANEATNELLYLINQEIHPTVLSCRPQINFNSDRKLTLKISANLCPHNNPGSRKL